MDGTTKLTPWWSHIKSNYWSPLTLKWLFMDLGHWGDIWKIWHFITRTRFVNRFYRCLLLTRCVWGNGFLVFSCCNATAGQQVPFAASHVTSPGGLRGPELCSTRLVNYDKKSDTYWPKHNVHPCKSNTVKKYVYNVCMNKLQFRFALNTYWALIYFNRIIHII